MALRITCPHCGSPLRLEEPYPLPGEERQCTCGRALSITYPVGMMDNLRRKGARFAGDAPPAGASPAPPRMPLGAVSGRTFVPEDEAPTVKERHDGDDSTPGTPHSGVLIPGEPDTGPTTVAPIRPAPRVAPAPREAAARPARDAAGRIRIDPADDPDATAIHPGRGPAPAPSAPPPRGAPPKGSTSRPPPAKPALGAAPRKRSRLRRFFGATAALLMLVLVAGGVTAWVMVRQLASELPSVEQLGAYRPPTVTFVYDSKGRVLGEIYDQRRYVVPLDRIPKHVQEAFISAEDANFRAHGGVDYMGIVRAILRNAAQGRKAQGASTITQQVAKNFLLTSEKTYTRKIKEMLLARRIEETFDKDHILYLYLNEIYLGSKAYGVEAAARAYFGKHVEELSVAEAAMIAGLPQRPSDYSPHRHFDKAKARQQYVLGQMADNGVITRAEADAAYAEPLELSRRTNTFLREAPWFTEYVRIKLVEAYGEDKVLRDGIEAYTTCDLDLQKVAQAAVTDGVTAVDSRKGWRGTGETLAEADIAARVAKYAAATDDTLVGERYPGIVLTVEPKHMVVDLGAGQALIPLSWTTWASPVGDRKSLDDLTKVFHRGDVLTIEVTDPDFREAAPFKDYQAAGEGPFVAGKVFQSPELEGALFSYRLTDGAVLAMVGGVDFLETKFNRATQAQRQVGSTFKPIVYAAAIQSRAFTTGSIVPDAPLVYNTLNQELWKPENYGESYLGDITLRRALALSRNVVTIRVLDRIGITPVYDLARKLGIESPMDQDLSMGLGSSSLNMPELARAYSAFATLGRKVEPHYIEKVVDRDGAILEQYTPPAAWEQVLDPNVAGIMNWMLVEVATAGTAAKSNALGLHVAGKTGTTNDNKDVWFVGFTPDVLTTVWAGYDQPRTITANATGGQIALPIWMEYMKVAVPKSEDRAFPTAPNLTWIGVDEATGRPMQGGRSMPFLSGTGPTGVATVAGQKTTEDILTTEF